MTKRRVVKSVSEESTGPNWLVIGGIAAVGVFALLVLLVLNVTQGGSVAAEPTPALGERVSSLGVYCDSYPDRCIVDGAENAPVTFIEISDYGCPHCYNFNVESVPTLRAEFVDTGLVRWVVVPFALNNGTHPSARATFCAAEQGSRVGVEFHEKLFELQNTRDAHTPAGFSSVARLVGLDVAAFDACVQDQRYDSLVHLNRQAAAQAGVSSTPTTFINDRPIAGNVGLAVFQQRLREAVAAAN